MAAPARKRGPQPPKGPRDPATRYAESVVAGKVVVGRLVRLACERHLRDLKAGKFVWNQEAVKRVINFFRDVLRLNGGKFEGKPFELEPWQAFIVGSVFGWQHTDGTRRFRTAYLEIGKGNGKSPLAAGVGLYCLTSDGEARAEVYAAAAKLDQAQILFRDAVAMVDQSPALAKRIIKSGVQPVWNLAFQQTGSFFRPLGSDKAQSGYRPHCALLDEIHEHENGLVLDLLRAGTKGRTQALLFEITNSGWDRESVCWQHHEYSRKILNGALDNDEWFAYVCALDGCEEHPVVADDGCGKCDDWRDDKVWKKANPNLGISVTKDYLQRQVREAEGMPAQQSLIRRLNFCQWTQQANPWVDIEVWNRNAAEPQPITGRACYAGLDLSRRWDLSSFVRVFPSDDGLFDVHCRFWMPEDLLRLKIEQDRAPYDQWVREGYIELTPGDTIDHNFIRQRIKEDDRVTPIHHLAFDPAFGGTEMSRNLLNDGISTVEIAQTFGRLSPPMNSLERLLVDGKLRHGGNPVLRWMVSNVAVVSDPAGRTMPAKNKSTGRIDGVSALLMGFFLVVTSDPPPPPPSVWVMG